MPRNSIKHGPPATALLPRHLLAIVAVLFVAGCGGGGCSGCACGGVTPLAEGFKPANRIENAGSVRLTDSGLTFLQQNLSPLASALLGGSSSGGVLTFNIPHTPGGSFPASYDVCPDGPNPGANPPSCVAEIDVAHSKLTIKTTDPYDIHITGTLPVRLRDLPIAFQLVGIPGTATGTLTADGSCPGSPQPFDDFPLDVDIAIHVDQNSTHSRLGYTKVEVAHVVNDTDAQGNLKSHLNFCGGLGAGILNLVEPLIIGQLSGGVIGTLKTQIDQQLCQKANPMLNPTCPTGTNDVDGVCRYGSSDTDECASIVVGADGHINLGGLLASVSPGTMGGLDFLFAAGGVGKSSDHNGYAWGDLDPVANGVTLGMYGGAEPNPLSKCVKLSELALPKAIPIPAELFGNTVPGWPAGTPGPHLGLAVSERFANYALNGLYNSGLLCIGISTDASEMLNSGTIGLLASSSKMLGLQEESQQIAIVIRPASPPTIAFGNGTDIAKDPLLRIKLDQAAFDFYIFSLDRFIRFMTATFDLDVPMNLTVTPAGLTPVLKKIGVNNGKVTNSSLLREDPDTIAASIADLLSNQVGQLAGGGLKPIDLSASLASLGLNLVIPDTVEGQGSPGLRKLTQGTDAYLGIFAAFALPPGAGGPVPPSSKTSAELVNKKVDPRGLALRTIREDNAPIASLYVGSSLDDGTRAIEYQYRVDQGFWHPYTRDRRIDVQDGWLRAQGRHRIAVRSKVVGDPATLDPDPAQVEVVVDVEPPSIAVSKVIAGKVGLTLRDKVSGDRSLARVRLDGGPWSDWQPASALSAIEVGQANDIAVEARDEEGNVGSVSQALIRGRVEAAAAGCGCAVAGGEEPSGGAVWLLGIAVAGVASRLWRRDRAGKPAANAVFSGPAPRRTLTARSYVAPLAVLAVASTWAGCNCGVETAPTTSSSTSSGDAPIALDYGLIGAYTSTAVAGSTLWVAGYAEADWENGNSYGDLVVGKWNGKSVDWHAVDGVPAEPPPDSTMFDVNGFRGGQTAAGDDVGLWTSIALDASGSPAVAYYDRTHKALKLAKLNGAEWTVSTVDSMVGADIGRYAKIVALGGGFVIAYETIAPGGDNGALVSTVRVATTTIANPTPADWKREDAVTDKNTPCRPAFCGSGTACIAETKRCTAELAASKCSPACAASSACIDSGGQPTCAVTASATKIDAYPEAVGDYIAISPDPKGTIGIAYYDRTHGDLGVASHATGAWVSKIVDGSDAAGKDTGDVGVGASLFIDASNDWHLAYVDGLAESLRYLKLTGGTKPNPVEVIDDGLGIAGKPFADGQHLVGDDAHLVVSPSGEVRVSYQDATAGTLHYAVGTIAADKHTWSVQLIKQDHFAGAFSSIVELDGKLSLVNWWRAGVPSVVGDVALVTP